MVFVKYAKYYDLLYQDKDYKAESDYISSLIKKYHPETKKILEFGSGSGIHGRLLGDLGYQVYGIERSQQMIDLGYKKADLNEPISNFNCVLGDCTKTFIGNDFDAVISLFHVISYQTSNKSITAMLNNACRQLKPGGIFIFDYWYAPAVWNYRPTLCVKKVENSELKITRIAEPECWEDKNRVDVNYLTFVEDLSSGQISKIEETHEMRAFDLDEITQFSSSAGFEVLHSEEWITKLSPSHTTWGVCSVLKKVIAY
jgi:SAM-dependent methyltransferase